MNRLRGFFRRLASMFRRNRHDDDLAAELESHLQFHIEDNLRAGMSPEEARRQALLKLGGLDQTKEHVRAQRALPWLESVAQDIRFALRMLRKNPGFTAVAVLTLALGIGANTAIFSAVNGILLEQLPYANPSQLVEINSSIKIGKSSFYGVVSQQYLDAIRASCPAFGEVAGFATPPFTMIAGSTPERISGAQVSPELFSLLGVAPMLGRPVLPSDAAGASGSVVVLSYDIWKASFAGDPQIVGRIITLDAKPYTIVGVMPRGFEFPFGTQGVWVPFSPGGGPSRVVARLKPGATRAQAEDQLSALAARLPGPTKTWTLVAHSLDDVPLRDSRAELPVLLGAVAFVLLIACINVSALLLARGVARRSEIAVREALGATRWRVCRQLLTEGLLLSFLGAAVALLFSPWAIRAVRLIAPPGTPRLDSVRLDAHVLWFALAISVLSAIAFALAPALQLSTPGRSAAMQKGLASSRRGFGHYAARRFRDSLVVLEIAAAVVLVIGAALVGRSFQKLLSLNLGFHTDHVLTMRVNLSSLSCHDVASCKNAESAILDRVRAVPKVGSAAFTSSLPFNSGMAVASGLSVEGSPEMDGLSRGTQITFRTISSDYFQALGIPLLAGRTFRASEPDSQLSVVVNQTLSRRYFSGDPLGKRISWERAKDGSPLWYTVVGVVADSRDITLTQAPSLEFYVPSSQAYMAGIVETLIVRTGADPLALLASLREEIWSIDKNAPLTSIRTMDQVVADSTAEPRFRTILLGSFAALGLLLAIVGTYGVISYAVSQRTHEIGVRIALGAGRKDVLRLVLGHGMLLAAAGVVAGIVGALALTRLLSSFLFNVTPTDPATFALVVLTLLLASFLACYIPARRAMRIDPVAAMRCD